MQRLLIIGSGSDKNNRDMIARLNAVMVKPCQAIVTREPDRATKPLTVHQLRQHESAKIEEMGVYPITREEEIRIKRKFLEMRRRG